MTYHRLNVKKLLFKVFLKFFLFKPFKKGNITSGSNNMGFGSGLISFTSVRNFISNNTKRKKSAPEPEIKKNMNNPVKHNNNNNNSNINDDDDLDYVNDHYSSKVFYLF
jgi:hypothetical protein